MDTDIIFAKNFSLRTSGEMAGQIVSIFFRAREPREPNYHVQPYNMELMALEKRNRHKPDEPRGEQEPVRYKPTRRILRHMVTNHGIKGKNYEYYSPHHHG
ncbi:hypothetical protein [Methanogenium cariaci]|jgi:hypothetical protein